MNCLEIDRPSPSPSYVSDDMNKNAGVYVLNTLLSGPFFVHESAESTLSYDDETRNICPIVFPINLNDLQEKIKPAEKKKDETLAKKKEDETIKGEYLYPIALELAGYRVEEISVDDFKKIEEPEESLIGILYSFTGKDPLQGVAGAGPNTPQIQWTALKRTTVAVSWNQIAPETWSAFTPILKSTESPSAISLETIVNPDYSSAKNIMLKYFDQLHSIFFVYIIEAKPIPPPLREEYVEIKVFPNPVDNGEKARFKIATHTSPGSIHSTEAWMNDLETQLARDTNIESWNEEDRSYPSYESYRIPIDIQTQPLTEEEEEEEEETQVERKALVGGKRSKSRKAKVRGRKTKRRLRR